MGMQQVHDIPQPQNGKGMIERLVIEHQLLVREGDCGLMDSIKCVLVNK